MTDPLRWTPNLVQRFWDAIARTKLSEKSFSRLVPDETFAMFKPFLRQDARYLDFGAGDGAFAEFLIRRGFSVAIYEPSRDRAKIAHDRLQSAGPGYLGTMSDPSGERFDGIFLLEVIEHIDQADLRNVLDRISQFLSEDGAIFVTTPNREDLEAESCIDPVSLRMFHRWQHVRSYDRNSLQADLRQAGFEPIVIHEIDVDVRVFDAIRRATGFEDVSEVFDTRVPMRIGDGERLVGVFARESFASPSTTMHAPIEIGKRWVLDAPPGPVGSVRANGAARIAETPRTVLTPAEITHDAGVGFVVAAPNEFGAGDDVGVRRSRLVVLEDGRPLGPPGAAHSDVRNLGAGRYSHWGEALIFSASDNSDPRTNGRVYSLCLLD